MTYGLVLENSNININDQGKLSANDVTITGHIQASTLKVTTPRKIKLTYTQPTGKVDTYSGLWDLNEELHLQLGCTGSCSGSCVGSCSGGCQGNCVGSCSGGCGGKCTGCSVS